MKKVITIIAAVLLTAGFILVFSESDYSLGITALSKLAGFVSMYLGYRGIIKTHPELEDNETA